MNWNQAGPIAAVFGIVAILIVVTQVGLQQANFEAQVPDWYENSTFIDDQIGANFIDGANSTVQVTSDPANNRVDVQIDTSYTKLPGYVVCASNAQDTDHCDVVADGTDDQTDVANAITAGRRNIILSDGDFNFDNTLTIGPTVDGLSIKGSGIGYTNIHGGASVSGLPIIYVNGDALDFVEDLTFQDFYLEGSGVPGGNVGDKGIGGQYVRRLRVHNIYIEDIPATGFGIDLLDDAVITASTVTNAGTDGCDPGCNGWGIGTGGQANEPVVFQGVNAFNNGNVGFLFEDQNLGQAGGNIILDGVVSSGNKRGVRSTGAQRIIVSDSHIYDSTLDGVLLVQGFGEVVEDIFFDTVIIRDNGDDGIEVMESTPTPIRINVVDSTIRGNAARGIEAVASKFLLSGSDISLNGEAGLFVQVSTAANAQDTFHVVDNRIYNNGQTGGAGNNDGANLRGEASVLSRVTFSQNHVFDDQGSPTQRFGLILSGTAGVSEALVTENHFWGNTSGAVTTGGGTANVTYRSNKGFTTENSGTATVASGTTSIAVSHGLDLTPTAQDCSVTPTNDMGDATKFWTSGFGASNFTINVDVDPNTSSADFAWECAIY